MVMSIRIREQAGTDAGRKFDYQMAVALDYLLSEIDNDVIVVIETLEDFAIFRNFKSVDESVDVYQVKTKNRGLYSKNDLYSDNVIGKIILTDFYFNSRANALNIITNTPLKGNDTESLDSFSFEDTLSKNNLEKLKKNVLEYLNSQPDFNGNVDDYWGKLVYIKSSLSFSTKDNRYEQSLIGKTHETISHCLGDENHSINPQGIFETLKLLIDKKRRNRFDSENVSEEEAINKKGISTDTVKQIIGAARCNLSKEDILNHAARIFDAPSFVAIKEEYPTFLSYKANPIDLAFQQAKQIVEDEFCIQSKRNGIKTDEALRQTAENCVDKIAYYSAPVIQIITILVVFGE